MSRPSTYDLRKRFASLYRFIETELTEANWRDLIGLAANIMPPPIDPDRPIKKRACVFRWRGSARWPGLNSDIADLAAARTVQARLREELAAIGRGDSSPAFASVSRLLDRRFDRLKRLLTNPPIWVDDRMIGTTRAFVLRKLAYGETKMVERECQGSGCSKKFIVPRNSRKLTCSRACAIDADNARRKQRREARSQPTTTDRT